MFLGTPIVAAECLQSLLSEASKHNFEIVAVGSQPPVYVPGSSKILPSPVHVCAMKNKISSILTPGTAEEPEFINTMKELDIDLCITAAYGNYLPQKFLAIPKFGTINIHPSLLPKYRGWYNSYGSGTCLKYLCSMQVQHRYQGASRWEMSPQV
jgi:methionyl-tRNA formyltransferase